MHKGWKFRGSFSKLQGGVLKNLSYIAFLCEDFTIFSNFDPPSEGVEGGDSKGSGGSSPLSPCMYVWPKGEGKSILIFFKLKLLLKKKNHCLKKSLLKNFH